MGEAVAHEGNGSDAGGAAAFSTACVKPGATVAEVVAPIIKAEVEDWESGMRPSSILKQKGGVTFTPVALAETTVFLSLPFLKAILGRATWKSACPSELFL